MLALADVSYTQRRRFISPLEQHVHGYMEVLPVVAGRADPHFENWLEAPRRHIGFATIK
jgi:hypothetical protein